jgi:hypothetical protein
LGLVLPKGCHGTEKKYCYKESPHFRYFYDST